MHVLLLLLLLLGMGQHMLQLGVTCRAGAPLRRWDNSLLLTRLHLRPRLRSR